MTEFKWRDPLTKKILDKHSRQIKPAKIDVSEFITIKQNDIKTMSFVPVKICKPRKAKGYK